MNLESKLTEEQKARILNETERERRKVLVWNIYEKDVFDYGSLDATINGAYLALQKLYVIFDDEGHGYRKKENQIEGYGKVLQFLDEYLGETDGE